MAGRKTTRSDHPLGTNAETTNNRQIMKMREQIDHLTCQLDEVRAAFEDVWGTVSLYLSEEQIENVKTYHAEEFAILGGSEE